MAADALTADPASRPAPSAAAVRVFTSVIGSSFGGPLPSGAKPGFWASVPPAIAGEPVCGIFGPGTHRASAPVEEPEDQRDHGEGRYRARECNVGEDRAGKARQHADADHRHRVADEAADEIDRHDGGALVRRRALVHHLQAGAVAEAG